MLLDTSGLFSFFDASDGHHQHSRELFATAPTRVLHNYVLAEFIPLCRSRGADMREALAFAFDLINSPLVHMTWVDVSLHLDAMRLLESRPDKTYSLCDAVSFLVMRQRGTSEALTTDRHFAQEGFVRLLE